MPIEPCLEWAYNALRDYNKECDFFDYEFDVFDKVGVTVVLMGATQQGKTSLALRLLGAEPSQITELDKALGGSSKVGRSRTRSTTILTASGSSSYKEDLKKLTQKVLKNESNPCKELHLDLPLDGGKGTRITRIVDLVGLESRTETAEKRKFAEEEAAKWLQRADLKIVVVKVNSITDIVIGKNSWAYRKELRNLFGYWHIDPHTSFIAVTFAWENTKRQVFNGRSQQELLQQESPLKVHQETTLLLKETLKAEFAKETGSEKLTFPNVTVLPFSLPPEIDMNDPRASKIYYATELSFDVIKKRVLYEKPLVFKLKSVFAHPRKIAADKLAEITALESIIEDYEREKEGDKSKQTDEQSILENCKCEVKKVKKHIALSKKSPDVIISYIMEELYRISKLEFPSIEKMRENADWRLFGGDQHSMKENIQYKMQKEYEYLTSKVLNLHKKIRKIPNIPDNIKSTLPYDQINDIITVALESRRNRFSMPYIERVLPDRWHKDDGWGNAVFYLKNHYRRQINSVRSVSKKKLERLFASHDFLNASGSLVKSEAFVTNYEIQKGEIKRARAKRERKIKQLSKDVNSATKMIGKLQKRLESTLQYKYFLSSNYVKYWNSRIALLNSSTVDDIRRIDTLGELVNATELFEEITEFATHESVK